MDFRIADTFTESLARLTGDEQKAVKTTAFDLQLDPVNPGMSFHKLDKAKDKRFWSVRVSQDIRLIVHRTPESLLLCYVDHHDKAYAWAERRKLETHPSTGAAQLVEIRERVQEIQVPAFMPAAARDAKGPLLFPALSDEDLLGYGVPADWLGDARAATEDTLLALTDHLPAEAAEALLELAVGGVPRRTEPVPPEAGPFEHPDALRRFRVVTNVEELTLALDYPWEKWTVFLHPAQKELVERRVNGPARVAGSAGTGKTVVALHRAAHLARANPEARILLTTFSDPLASALHVKLSRLIGTEPRLRERIDVDSLDAVVNRLRGGVLKGAHVAPRDEVRRLVRESAAKHEDGKFKAAFVVAEWEDVVDAWQLDSWEAYRDVARLGRKTRLPEKARRALWSIFADVRAKLEKQNATTNAGLYGALTRHFFGAPKSPYDFVVIDEAQDISVAQLRFVAALGGQRPDGLFFAGDLGQRIFQLPFSWMALGVDVRGRSSTLRINYRTSHQIRTHTDRLLGREVSDVDGNVESRRGTVSVFNGPPPSVQTFASQASEASAVGEWLKARQVEGLTPNEIAVFVRSDHEIERARTAAKSAGLEFKVLDEKVETARDRISLATMHLAKGLEFRAVVVMACDDEIIPLQSRISEIGDEADLEEVYDTERQLLYVACTRARDQLLVTGVEPASEFLEDLGAL